jgi:hypothetical protein
MPFPFTGRIQLHQFPLDQVLHNLGHCLNHSGLPNGAQHFCGPGQYEVTDEDGLFVAPSSIDCGLAAARVRLIDHIVMDLGVMFNNF